jgi:GrpB-like predicted nucleotidyltransferase (UPF0157 family)
MIVEHIGSTSVPGCAGKGVIDLMLLYPDSGLQQGNPHPGGNPEPDGRVRSEGRPETQAGPGTAGGLEHAKQVLESLGFQHQSSRDPWPESRPMRLGAISYNGKSYRIHVHVISATSPEPAGLRAFRDTLNRDPALRQAYIDRKRAIIAAGITDSVDYSEAKGDFISGALELAERTPSSTDLD